MGTFAFGGKTIVAPGILVSSEIGAQRVLQLLPFGKVAMIGAADGGSGDGTVYSFNDTVAAQRVLRAGPLLDALLRAALAGASSGFIGVVAGTKTSSSLALTATGSGEGSFPGVFTITPASMENIIDGQPLEYGNLFDSTGEQIVASNVTATTFDATLTKAHAAGETLTNNPGGLDDGGTTLDAVSSTGSHSINVTTGTLSQEGAQYVIDTGANQETVVLTASAAGTESGSNALVTAVFTKTHASGVAWVPVAINTTVPAAISGATSASATLNSGDQGTWTNKIAYSAVAGTTSGTAVTISYPDPLSGATVYIGGPKSAFDNLASFSALAKAIAANTILTPPPATGLPAIVTLDIAEDGTIGTLAKTFLAGGTGGGSQTLAFSDVKAAVDAMIDVNFDIGHLVQIYDLPSQAYADAQAVQVSTYGRLRRWIHQIQVDGAVAGQLKTVNSEAVSNALIAAATAINSIRSSVVAQQQGYTDPNTGNTLLVDAAPFIVGLASLKGATGDNGPATPLTFETVPGGLSVDFPVLATTGDVDNAILAGGIVLEQVGFGGNASVRIVQSVTTAPLDSNGDPWIFGEFSVVRVSDALLANCIAALESGAPKTIGGGNTQAVMQSALAEVRDVLEDAQEATWITGFDPTSISIFTTGNTGEDDILQYSASPTVPLNHIGITQTLIPFQGPVALGGQVNG